MPALTIDKVKIYEYDMGIAGFSLLVTGLLFMVGFTSGRKKNARCSAQTEGVLMKAFDTENAAGSTGRAYLYSCTVGGVGYQLRTGVRSPQTKDAGDSCTVWYNPAKPKDAQVFHDESEKQFRLFLIIGTVLILPGIALICFGLARSA